MLNKIIFQTALILFTVSATAQNFEGKISYSNIYQSKVANLKSEQLSEMMGSKQDYYIKGMKYKSILNGAFLKMQLYNPKQNKSYTLTGKNDTLYWEDCSINNEEAIKYELQKNKDTILGIPCDLMIIEAKSSKTYYYYNSKYAVNPELFKEHNYGNWYLILSKTKSLPLKTVYETDQFIMTGTATEIKAMKLEDAFFTMPYKNKIAKAYWKK